MAHYHCFVPHCNNDKRKKSGKEFRYFNFPAEREMQPPFCVTTDAQLASFWIQYGGSEFVNFAITGKNKNLC